MVYAEKAVKLQPDNLWYVKSYADMLAEKGKYTKKNCAVLGSRV